MSKASTSSAVQDGALVLTVEESQFHGDPLAEKVRQEFLSALADSGLNLVVIDLHKVEYISTAAFRPLLSLRRKLQDSSGRMVLCGLSDLVREVFQVLRLITTSRSYPATFEVQPDVPAALAFLKQTETVL
jgi:anti-anti-sigma factor